MNRRRPTVPNWLFCAPRHPILKSSPGVPIRRFALISHRTGTVRDILVRPERMTR